MWARRHPPAVFFPLFAWFSEQYVKSQLEISDPGHQMQSVPFFACFRKDGKVSICLQQCKIPLGNGGSCSRNRIGQADKRFAAMYREGLRLQEAKSMEEF
jgi:hypothetical protein